MGEKQKILLSGLSRIWGRGGEHLPLEVNGCHYENLKWQELDNKDLSAKEYFQYKMEENGVYSGKLIIHDLNHNILECVKCHDTSHVLEPCNNCGSSSDLIWNLTDDGSLFCTKCLRQHQQNRWSCSKCKCDNSINNTLYHWVELEILPKGKEKCFIATACYGDYYAPEVLIFRQFRDDKLLQSFYGRALVKFYYFVSPFFVTLISKSERLKKIVRQYLLEPIAQKIQRQINNRKKSL